MAKESNKKQSKENKHFFKDFKSELKRVIWPTPKQLFNNTVAVISIVLIVAVIVFALDFAFTKLNEHGIEKLKSVVVTNTETNTTATNSQAVETETSNTASNTESANNEESNSEENKNNTTENKTEKNDKKDSKNETTNTAKK